MNKSFQSINFPNEQGVDSLEESSESSQKWCFQSINFPNEQGDTDLAEKAKTFLGFQSINFPNEQGE